MLWLLFYHTHKDQIITLQTLKLHHVMYQLYLIKAGKNENTTIWELFKNTS